jgi:hypothetical protein
MSKLFTKKTNKAECQLLLFFVLTRFCVFYNNLFVKSPCRKLSFFLDLLFSFFLSSKTPQQLSACDLFFNHKRPIFVCPVPFLASDQPTHHGGVFFWAGPLVCRCYGSCYHHAIFKRSGVAKLCVGFHFRGYCELRVADYGMAVLDH